MVRRRRNDFLGTSQELKTPMGGWELKISRVQALFIALEPPSFLPYVLMITLQGADLAVAAAESGYPSDGGCGCGNGGDIGNFVLNGRLSNIGIIVLAQFAAGGVDDQLDLPVFDTIHDIGTTLVHFQDWFTGNALAFQKFLGPIGGPDLKTQSANPRATSTTPSLSLSDTVIRTVPSEGST